MRQEPRPPPVAAPPRQAILDRWPRVRTRTWRRPPDQPSPRPRRPIPKTATPHPNDRASTSPRRSRASSPSPGSRPPGLPTCAAATTATAPPAWCRAVAGRRRHPLPPGRTPRQKATTPPTPPSVRAYDVSMNANAAPPAESTPKPVAAAANWCREAKVDTTSTRDATMISPSVMAVPVRTPARRVKGTRASHAMVAPRCLSSPQATAGIASSTAHTHRADHARTGVVRSGPRESGGEAHGGGERCDGREARHPRCRRESSRELRQHDGGQRRDSQRREGHRDAVDGPWHAKREQPHAGGGAARLTPRDVRIRDGRRCYPHRDQHQRERKQRCLHAREGAAHPSGRGRTHARYRLASRHELLRSWRVSAAWHEWSCRYGHPARGPCGGSAAR